MAELKPCPFCGRPVRQKVRYKKPVSFIWCKNCNVSMTVADQYTEADGKQRLLERWNRRANDD